METLISYGLGVIGVVMTAMVVIPALSNSMPYPSTRLMITNLLRTNPRQAELACKTGEGTFLEGIGSAIKTAAMLGGSRDPGMIQKATIPSYDAGAAVAVQKWKGYLMKAKLGAMAAGGSVVLGFQKGTPILLIILALAVGAGYGFLFLRTNEVERSMVLARREVLPEVDRVFIDGRY
ncbi:MAG: hypothetical protein KF773_34790 [Deltaproteobacteria bacterium]|nr:hypothetical protein [Deltaproteobacteria bacterium]MCW5808568.1 hypothetical protein [Deltaproteobacteria bacterium]